MRPYVLPLPVVQRFMRVFYWCALHPRLSFGTQRALLQSSAPIQPLPNGLVVRHESLGGVPVERITVGATERETAVLYLHGGAFTMGSPATHRPLTSTLALDTGAVVYVPDYRLAPEHPYPAALDDAEAAWDALRSEHGFGPESIAIAGDSAGGSLAAALARRLVDKGENPAAIALISPWVNPGDSNPPFERDLVVNTGWSNASAAAYLAGGDAADPGFAPALGNLAGFPPTIVHVGTSEVLYDQVSGFAEKLRAAGVDVTYVEFEKLWHVAHLQATMMAEAADAVRELGSFLSGHLSAAGTARRAS